MPSRPAVPNWSIWEAFTPIFKENFWQILKNSFLINDYFTTFRSWDLSNYFQLFQPDSVSQMFPFLLTESDFYATNFNTQSWPSSCTSSHIQNLSASQRLYPNWRNYIKSNHCVPLIQILRALLCPPFGRPEKLHFNRDPENWLWTKLPVQNEPLARGEILVWMLLWNIFCLRCFPVNWNVGRANRQRLALAVLYQMSNW